MEHKIKIGQNKYHYGHCKNFFAYYFYKKGFWVRIFGIGISVKNAVHHPLLFSQRMGIQKYLKIGNYIVSYLPKKIK